MNGSEVVEIDPFDDEQFDQWFSVQRIKDQERRPDLPGWQRAELLAWGRLVDGAERTQPVLARDAAGQPIGISHLETFTTENQHLGRTEIYVVPSARRQGVGRALLAAIEEMASNGGRTQLAARDEEPTRPDFVSHAKPFAESNGFRPVQVMVRRELTLPLGDQQRRTLLENPKTSPVGYSIETFDDRWPDGDVADRAELGRRMSTDAPHEGQDLDEEVWTPERVRQMEALLASQNRAKLIAAARDDTSGEVVAFSEIAVPLGAPESVWQHDTLVLREHRGHGLGYALKMANLIALGDRYPAARRLSTWNAAENEPMIAVNDEMGFEVTAHSTTWMKAL
ncbi:MAG TPA: GNAT family N-acetyltransferase [Acidimicrobiales bacterium]